MAAIVEAMCLVDKVTVMCVMNMEVSTASPGMPRVWWAPTVPCKAIQQKEDLLAQWSKHLHQRGVQVGNQMSVAQVTTLTVKALDFVLGILYEKDLDAQLRDAGD